MKNAFKKRKLQMLSWIIAIAVFTAQFGGSTVAYASQVDENEITNEETSMDTNQSLEYTPETDSISNSTSTKPNDAELETKSEEESTSPNDDSKENNTEENTKASPEPEKDAVTSDETTINEILAIASTDGSQAGILLNEFTDLDAFENGVRQVLNLYYTEDPNNQLGVFEEAIDERANEIIQNFKGAALEREQEAELNYVPGEIIVVLEDNVDAEDITEKIEESQAGTFEVIETVEDAEVGIVQITLDQTVEEAIAEYEDMENVAYAQPNYIYSLPENEFSTTSIANDPFATEEKQWHLTNIYASSAWEFMKKCNMDKVRVAVLDTGVDTSHPDLQVCLNKNLCVDTTSMAIIKSTTDDVGHGTHVSGIIGATSNNGIGVAGVATGASNSVIDLMVVDVFTKNGNDVIAYTDDIMRGLNYAHTNGAKIINLSLGYKQSLYSSEDKSLEDTINSITQNGTLVVCAAGNGDEDSAYYGYGYYGGYDEATFSCYPSDFEPVISVIATDSNNNRASFSNYGPSKDISAPGVAIGSTYPNLLYGEESGTSMAAPIVTAVAAMALSVKPTLTPANLKNLLYSTATDVYSPGWDSNSGAGVVNAYKAVTSAMNSGSATGISLKNTSIACGTSKTLSATLAPSYTTDHVTWSTSNSSIISIDGRTGKITANKIGQATITATTGSGKRATCVVSVNLNKATIRLKSTTYKNITISWKADAGASKYIVSRSTSKNGKYKKLATTTKKYYSDKTVKLGKNYYYKVKVIAINGSLTKTKQSAAFKATPKVSKVSSPKAKATSKTKIKLTWSKVTGATKYSIYRATSKKGTYKYIGKTTSTKYYSKSLKSKKTYYYKIVALRTVGKKTYRSSKSTIIFSKTK